MFYLIDKNMQICREYKDRRTADTAFSALLCKLSNSSELYNEFVDDGLRVINSEEFQKSINKTKGEF